MTDSNSQSAGVRIRASNLNRCNDTTVRTREVPLVHAHATSLLYHVHAVALCQTALLAVGRMENLLGGLPSYLWEDMRERDL